MTSSVPLTAIAPGPLPAARYHLMVARTDRITALTAISQAAIAAAVPLPLIPVAYAQTVGRNESGDAPEQSNVAAGADAVPLPLIPVAYAQAASGSERSVIAKPTEVSNHVTSGDAEPVPQANRHDAAKSAVSADANANARWASAVLASAPDDSRTVPLGSVVPDKFEPEIMAGQSSTVPVERRSFRHLIGRAAKLAGLVFVGWFAVMVGLLALFRFVDPPMSSLMVQHWLLGAPVKQTWVPIEKISPDVVRAVVSSEDSRFCDHAGVDFDEIRAAIKRGGNGTPRGASTISMQVIKNLLLWPSKSYIRKAVELPLTYIMELLWPKWRVMEVYLNIAEWGPGGVFGIEEAARLHFKTSAANLSAGDAARLAVVLPNPVRRNAGKPGPQTRRLAQIIRTRARKIGASTTSCILGN